MANHFTFITDADAILQAIQRPNSELHGPTGEGNYSCFSFYYYLICVLIPCLFHSSGENMDDFRAIGNDEVQPDLDSEAAPSPVDHKTTSG